MIQMPEVAANKLFGVWGVFAQTVGGILSVSLVTHGGQMLELDYCPKVGSTTS